MHSREPRFKTLPTESALRLCVFAVLLLLGIGLLPLDMLAQAPAPTLSQVEQGRALIAKLSGDIQTDADFFNKIGPPTAQAALFSVMQAAQNPSATSADWTEMHQAISGLIEFFAWRGELLNRIRRSRPIPVLFCHAANASRPRRTFTTQ